MHEWPTSLYRRMRCVSPDGDSALNVLCTRDAARQRRAWSHTSTVQQCTQPPNLHRGLAITRISLLVNLTQTITIDNIRTRSTLGIASRTVLSAGHPPQSGAGPDCESASATASWQCAQMHTLALTHAHAHVYALHMQHAHRCTCAFTHAQAHAQTHIHAPMHKTHTRAHAGHTYMRHTAYTHAHRYTCVCART